jgi:hypothetical protein
MVRSCVPWVLLSTCLIVFSACGPKPPANLKETFPVKGKVLVDGQPAAMLMIDCVAAAGIDKANPSLATAMTEKDGTFSLSTYKAGDGVPEGDYVLIFQWVTLNRFQTPSNNNQEVDKLNGRYTDPQTSTVKFSVKKGQPPLQLPDIQLTTQ